MSHKPNSSKKYCEIRYSTSVDLVNIKNELRFKFESEYLLAVFLRQNRMSCRVSNIHCLPKRMRKIAYSHPVKERIAL